MTWAGGKKLARTGNAGDHVAHMREGLAGSLCLKDDMASKGSKIVHRACLAHVNLP